MTEHNQAFTTRVRQETFLPTHLSQFNLVYGTSEIYSYEVENINSKQSLEPLNRKHSIQSKVCLKLGFNCFVPWTGARLLLSSCESIKSADKVNFIGFEVSASTAACHRTTTQNSKSSAERTRSQEFSPAGRTGRRKSEESFPVPPEWEDAFWETFS